MVCNKCKHALPSDSVFCQYCGSKLENIRVNSETERIAGIEKSNFVVGMKDVTCEETTPHRSQKAFVETQREENKAGNNDAGTYKSTHLQSSVNAVKFCTACGNPLAENGRFCTKCGANVASGKRNANIRDTVSIHPAMIKNDPVQTTDSRLFSAVNIVAIVLAIISIIFIVVAMNVQDLQRNYEEEISPTVLYSALIALYSVFIFSALLCRIKQRSLVQLLISLLLPISFLVTAIQGSVFSEYYAKDGLYINHEEVTLCNVVWSILSFAILIVCSLPGLVEQVKRVRKARYGSVRYREQCYKRVAKIHGYLKDGIISQEEYEQTKRDILKYIR